MIVPTCACLLLWICSCCSATVLLDGTSTPNHLVAQSEKLTLCSKAFVIVKGNNVVNIQNEIDSLRDINNMIVSMIPQQGTKEYPDLFAKHADTIDRCAGIPSNDAHGLGNGEDSLILTGDTTLLCAPSVKGLEFLYDDNTRALAAQVEAMYKDLPFGVSFNTSSITHRHDEFETNGAQSFRDVCASHLEIAKTRIQRDGSVVAIIAPQEIEFMASTVYVGAVEINKVVEDLRVTMEALLQTAPQATRSSGVAFSAQSGEAFSFSGGKEIIDGGILEIYPNGARGDYWQAHSPPQWVSMDVKSTTVGFIRLYCWRASCPYKVRIQTSESSTSFATHETTTFNPLVRDVSTFKDWTWIAFPRVTSRYIRLYVDETFGTGSWVTAAEIEFFPGCASNEVLIPTDVDPGVNSPVSYQCINIP